MTPIQEVIIEVLGRERLTTDQITRKLETMEDPPPGIGYYSFYVGNYVTVARELNTGHMAGLFGKSFINDGNYRYWVTGDE